MMKSLTEREIESAEEFVIYNEIENIAEKMLFILGFKSKLSGTRYIKDGIVQLYNHTLSCRELYTLIAQKYQTTFTRVERSIRHAIGDCYTNGFLNRLNDLFRYQILDVKYAPTNSEFMSAICTWVHIEKSKQR